MRTTNHKYVPVINIVSLVVILVFLFSLGCGKKDEKEIKIGIITPLTGDVSSWGEMQRRSTELALEDVKDMKIKVTYEDDRADPKVGITAFRKLLDAEKVPIVVGVPASNVTLAVAPIANERKVVLLTSGSTATEVGNAGPYVFRIMPSDEVQSMIMATWAMELDYKRVAVVYVENSWGQGLKDSFEKDFRNRGGTIVTVQPTTQDTTDYRTQLAKMKALQFDAIYAPLYTRGAGLLIKQARELGLKQQILGADVYGTPELFKAGGNATNGVLYTTFGKYSGPEYQPFAKKYKERYGVEPETYATYCYDAFNIAIEAIRQLQQKQKEISGPNLREELLKLKDYKGVTGTTIFDGQNSAKGKSFDKIIVKDGKHVPYQP